MAYLDPAGNHGSKPQRLGATNGKSSTSDKLQTFRAILHEITRFVLKGNLMQEKSQNLSEK